MACRGCEARKRFLINGVTSALTTVHTQYLKPAREFLEMVKQQMRYGGLDQLARRYVNEDGVKFIVGSRFGQDEMIIDVPGGRKEKEVVIRRPRIIGSQQLICGWSEVWGYVDEDGNDAYVPRATLWLSRENLIDLGVLTGYMESSAEEISDDGTTVVGWSRNQDWSATQAVYWKNNDPESIVGLGQLSGNVFPYSHAWGVSRNGKVIVGDGGVGSPASTRAFRWTEDSGMVSLGLISGTSSSNAYGVSANGEAVCGVCFRPPLLSLAFRWTASEGMVSLGLIAGSSDPTTAYTDAKAISADGSTIVGVGQRDSGISTAWRWTADTGTIALDTASQWRWSYAFGVSGNGQVVVGQCGQEILGVPSFAYRWTEDDGMKALPLVDGWTWAAAMGVSEDGTVVTGWGGANTGWVFAFRWSAATGMVKLGVLPGYHAGGEQAMGRDVYLSTSYEECTGRVSTINEDLTFEQLVARNLIPETCSPTDLDE